MGAVFAVHAAVAFWSAQRHAHMEEALRSRDVIGQAKGIIMVHEGIDEDAAFARLRETSQHLNIKLRDVAGRVAKSRDMPE